MSATQLGPLVREKLPAGENVVAWIVAALEGDILTGVAFVTTARVGFYRKKMIGERFEAIALDKLSSVDESRTFSHSIVNLNTSGGSLPILPVGTKQAVADFLNALENARRKASAGRETEVAGRDPNDPLSLLERLSRLREAGHLSETEFETKKADLLSRI